MSENKEAFFCIAFTSDGTTLAGGDHRGTVHIWNVDDGHHLRSLKHHVPSTTTAVAFSPNNRDLLAATYANNQLYCWDTDSGHVAFADERNNLRLTSVAFRPDGHILVTGCKDHSVGIWNMNQRRFLGHLLGPPPTTEHYWMGRVMCLAFDDSGNVLAAGHIDSSIRIWDLRSVLRLN